VPAFWLLIAAFVTFAWALLSALSGYYDSFLSYVSVLETLRAGAWVAFLVSLLSLYWNLARRVNYAFLLSIGIWFVFGFLLLMDALLIGGWIDVGEESVTSVVGYFMLGRLISSIGALALLENLYRSTPEEGRWTIRPISIALGAAFIFDIYMYAEATLFRSVDIGLLNARGVVQALCVPLIALTAARNPSWKMELQLSRRVVFHTVSLVATGVYLLAMSSAGLYIREFGGSWGDVLQIAFLFAALTALVIFAMSGTIRARARVLMQKHFFLHKYDYREEWLRFIRTMSTSNANANLDRRVVQATCDILDSPAGLLWLIDDNGGAEPIHSWNLKGLEEAYEPPGSPLLAFLAESQWIIDLGALRSGQGGDEYEGLELPEWAQDDEGLWLLVPLNHHEKLIGFILVAQPRAPRALNWEDHDLLKTVGRQAASYIAERRSQEALSQSKEFDAFNRRFAFIMHDLKNLVSQLGLLSRNAQKHMDKPDFREDMLQTLNSSVDKMNKMLAALHQEMDVSKGDQDVDIKDVLIDAFETKSRDYEALSCEIHKDPGRVKGQRDKLEQVFMHLIQNAIDASKDKAPIQLSLSADDDWAWVDIIDQGCGMDDDFIQNELFRPFRSTKVDGFGIGAYECREYVKAAGGKMKVKSVPGEGTQISVSLPIAKTTQERS
jgi:putative PEP-CTERM system histidine kinase